MVYIGRKLKKYQFLKIFLSIFLCLLVLLPNFTLAQGQESSANTDFRKLIKVGFFPFAGYHEIDSKGRRSGYGYDLLQQLLIYEDWRYEYVGYEENDNWQDMMNKLELGQIDILTSATKTPERELRFDYSAIPVGTSKTQIVVKAGNNTYAPLDFEHWNGMRIGVLPGNSRNISLAAYAKEHNFTYIPIELDSQNELLTALMGDSIDAIVTSNLLKINHAKVLDSFDEKPFYIMVRKGNTKLLQKINSSLSQLESDRPFFRDTLYNRYYGVSSGSKVTFSKEEQEYITNANKERKIWRVLANPDRNPLSYNDNGSMKGLLIDLTREIFNRTGLKVEFLTPKNREEYMDIIKKGKCDFICDFSGKNANAERNGFIYIDSFYQSNFLRVAKKDYNGKGIKNAMVRSSVTGHVITGLNNPNTYYCNNAEEAMEAVITGKADYLDYYARCAQEMVYADQTNSLTTITSPLKPVSFALVMDNQKPAVLSSIIRRSVASLTGDDVNEMAESYVFYKPRPTSFIGFTYEHPIIVIFLAAAFFLTILALYAQVVHKRETKLQQEANEQLAAALDEAKAASTAKTDFLSKMSHDIRTPMNAIIGMAALARDEVDNPQATLSYLDKITSAGDFLLNLVNDCLDIEKIEHNKTVLHPKRYRFKNFINSISTIFTPLCDAKHITFNTKEISDLNMPDILCDRLRVEQIFFNVISNAVKYTPEGGTITCKVLNPVLTSTSYAADYVIADTGIGMSKEFQRKMFDPFEQENKEGTNRTQGTGLGLTIMKSLIELMGGTLRIESEEGKGTTVTIHLEFPLAPKQEEKPKEAVMDIDQVLKDKKVLLFEDHPMNQEIANKLLAKKGVHVIVAENGQKGLAIFKTSTENYFDGILMDIRMPIMGGLEATRAIRSLDRQDAKTIPIIAMSANSYDEDVQKSLQAGMNAHLSKPVVPKHMYETLAKFISEQEAKRDTPKEPKENEPKLN